MMRQAAKLLMCELPSQLRELLNEQASAKLYRKRSNAFGGKLTQDICSYDCTREETYGNSTDKFVRDPASVPLRFQPGLQIAGSLSHRSDFYNDVLRW